MKPFANGRIAIQKQSIEALFRNIDKGRFAVPKLQREFVWDGRKAAKLFDSIYLGMPIGIPLIWRAKRSQKLFLRQRYHVLPAFNHANGEVWFLVDGQQRLSSLYNVKEGGTITNARGRHVNFERVVLTLSSEDGEEHIRYRKPVPGKFISLANVLHPHWRYKAAVTRARHWDEIRKCRKRILRYKAHLMFVRMGIEEVRECFLRINTQGMKLTAADAVFTKAEGLDLRDLVHEVREHIDRAFADIAEMPLLWGFAAIHGVTEVRTATINRTISEIEKSAHKDPKRRVRLSQEWSRLVRCIGKAADYLRDTFRVLNPDFLYTDYMLVMLALFFYWNRGGPSQTQAIEIKKWFWSTTIGNRYSGREFLRCLPDDVRYFRRLAEKKRANFHFGQLVERADVRRAQYQSHTGITAAFYCLLAGRRPVSILDNGLNDVPMDRYSTSANRKDRHHVFPRAPLRHADIPLRDYNSIANVCLLTAEENQRIGSRRPSSYLDGPVCRRKLFNSKMRRHLIPSDPESGLWDRSLREGFRRFVNARTDMLCKAFEAEAGIRLFRRERGW